MTEQPAKLARRGGPGPSRKAIIGWSAAALVVLALAWFIGAVAVPVWQTRRAVAFFQACWDLGQQEESARLTTHDAVISVALKSTMERLGGRESALKRLSTYLRLPDRISPHKAAATRLLGECGQGAAPPLIDLLAHESAEVRWASTESLHLLQKRGQFDPSGVALPAREKALLLLPYVGEVVAEGDVINPSSRAREARGFLAGAGPEALRPLMDALAHDHEVVSVAWMLSEIGRPAEVAVPALSRRLRMQYSGQSIARSIGAIGGERAREALAQTLKSDESLMRAAAATELGKMRQEAEGVVPELEKLLQDEDQAVQKAARRALWSIRPPKHDDPSLGRAWSALLGGQEGDAGTALEEIDSKVKKGMTEGEVRQLFPPYSLLKKSIPEDTEGRSRLRLPPAIIRRVNRSAFGVGRRDYSITLDKNGVVEKHELKWEGVEPPP